MARTLKDDVDLDAVATHVVALKPVYPAYTQAGSLSGNAERGNAERGKTFYGTCLACHGLEGQGNPALKAPALIHANDWYLLKQIENFRSGIRGSLATDVGGVLMRPMAMSLPNEQAIVDVVAYIETLRK